jgi:photosystem II stability/assembly factor-like uncharacterized protein
MHRILIGAVVGSFVFAISVTAFAQQRTWELQGIDKTFDATSVCISSTLELFAGTREGIYHSTDRGESWPFLCKLDNFFNRYITVDSAGTLFAYWYGISRSTDHGLTWAQSFSTDTVVYPMIVGPDGKLFAETYPYGVRLSADHGVTWKAVSAPGSYVNALIVDKYENLFVIGEAEGFSGVWCSRDEGSTWGLSYATMYENNSPLNVYSLMAARDGRLFGGTIRGLIESSDAGSTWRHLSAGLLDTALVVGLGEGGRGSLFAQTSDGQIFRSPDSARNWSHCDFAGNIARTGTIVSDPMGRVYVGTDAGVCYSDDTGQTWKGSATGFWHRHIMCFANGANRITYAGTDAGLFKTSDDGTTWKKCNSPMANSYVNAPVKSLLISRAGTIYAQCPGIGVLRSSDSTGSWCKTSLVDSVTATIQLDSAGNLVAGLRWGTILKSIDEGDTWTTKGSIPDTLPLITMIVDRKDRLLAGSDRGVFRSSDGGKTWGKIGPRPLAFCALALSGQGAIFAGTGNHGLFRSTDDGSTWDSLTCSFSSFIVSTVMPAPGGFVYVGTPEGAFLSTDNGDTWQADSSGLGNANIGALIVTSGGYVLAGTESGAYRSSVVLGISSHVPTSHGPYILFQNYPNPFNPSTTIRYTVPSRTHVTLAVFNTLGQQVATLVNESQETGYHDVRFDGSSLSSGVYFYRLQAGTYMETKKLLLIR